MSTPITVTSLPSINEIKSGDLLIVQSSTTTGVLRFDDFIIGEEHVSFYKDIQDLYTDVQMLSGQISPYISQFNTIGELESTMVTHTNSVSGFHDRVSTLQNNLDTVNTELITLQAGINQQLIDLEDRLTANLTAIEDRLTDIESRLPS